MNSNPTLFQYVDEAALLSVYHQMPRNYEVRSVAISGGGTVEAGSNVDLRILKRIPGVPQVVLETSGSAEASAGVTYAANNSIERKLSMVLSGLASQGNLYVFPGQPCSPPDQECWASIDAVFETRNNPHYWPREGRVSFSSSLGGHRLSMETDLKKYPVNPAHSRHRWSLEGVDRYQSALWVFGHVSPVAANAEAWYVKPVIVAFSQRVDR